jgi:hypothetical protein
LVVGASVAGQHEDLGHGHALGLMGRHGVSESHMREIPDGDDDSPAVVELHGDGLSCPFVLLTADLGQFGETGPAANRLKRSSPHNRGQLTRVTREHESPASLLNLLHDHPHVAGVDHAGFVDDDDGLVVDLDGLGFLEPVGRS